MELKVDVGGSLSWQLFITGSASVNMQVTFWSLSKDEKLKKLESQKLGTNLENT
jgi:hypothetical protein